MNTLKLGVYVLKMNSSGNYTTAGYWQKKYNNVLNNNDDAYRLILDGSNNIYVSGFSNDGTKDNLVVLKLNNNGNITWQKMFNTASSITPDTYENEYSGMVMDNIGNIYLTGYSSNGSNYDVIVVKVDNEGNKIWDKRINSSNNGNDRGYDITTDNKGNIYVTGKSNNGTNDDLLFLKMSVNQRDDNLFTVSNPAFTIASPGFEVNSPGLTSTAPVILRNVTFNSNYPGFRGIK